MGKALRLVTSFAELRRGMTIVDLICECGRMHETTPVELVEYFAREEKPHEGVAWRCLPDCLAGSRPPDHFFGVDDVCVRQNRIFEVLEAPPLRAREREKTRAR